MKKHPDIENWGSFQWRDQTMKRQSTTRLYFNQVEEQ